MRQDKTIKGKRDKTALALLLCFSVIAIVSVFTVKSSLNKIASSTINPVPAIPSVVEQPVNKQIPTVDSGAAGADSGENADGGNAASGSVFAAPVEGEIIGQFSTDMLVYSKTLDQYAVHNGVDIAAKRDTPVKAIAEGTITKACSDDRYGSLIEINHGNGYTSVYANLSGPFMVEVSDVVKKGDVIGGVGNSALFEVLDESHLHFELLKDGEPVDPCEFINF